MSQPDDPGGRRLPISRREDVLAAVTARGAIRVTDLAQELGVTPVTVRRDVAELARAGLVRRVHGGAVAVDDAQPARVVATAPAAGSALGMLVPSLSFYWPTVARGAEEAARDRGQRLVLRGSDYDAADERGDIARLLEGGVSGLLLAPTMHGTGGELMREWLADAGVPTVLLERTARVGQERRAVESVVTDHAAGAASAVYHLASLGHRRIGIAVSQGSPHGDQIRSGWQEARTDLGLVGSPAVDVHLPDRDDPSFDGALAELRSAIERTRNTALLIHSDPEAIRFLQFVVEGGLRVPEDLALVSYDDEVAALATPALTAVRPPRRTIGRTGVMLLASRMADPGRPVHQVRVSPTLHIRASTVPG